MSNPNKLERDLQPSIIQYLEQIPDCVVFKTIRCNVDNIPDLFFTTPRTGAWLLEVKKFGEEPRKGQYHMIAELNRCGTNSAYIAGWVDWIEFVRKIKLKE